MVGFFYFTILSQKLALFCDRMYICDRINHSHKIDKMKTWYLVSIHQWSDVMNHNQWDPHSYYESEAEAFVKVSQLVAEGRKTCKIDTVYSPVGSSPNI